MADYEADPSEALLFDQIANRTSFAMALFDSEMNPTFVNPALRELLGLVEHESSAFLVARAHCGDTYQAVGDVLEACTEWSGEIEISHSGNGQPVVLSGSLMRLRCAGPRYGLIARPRSDGVPDKIAQQLSKREQQVLDGLMRGEISKEIAQRLGISHRTVEAHRGKIMHKLDARSLPDLFQQIANASLA